MVPPNGDYSLARAMDIPVRRFDAATARNVNHSGRRITGFSMTVSLINYLTQIHFGAGAVAELPDVVSQSIEKPVKKVRKTRPVLQVKPAALQLRIRKDSP